MSTSSQTTQEKTTLFIAIDSAIIAEEDYVEKGIECINLNNEDMEV